MQKQADPFAFDGNHPFFSSCADGSVPRELQGHVNGYPKLLLKIFDKELADLAQANDAQWHLVSELPGFNTIDFRQVTCTCSHRKPTQQTADFESLFPYTPLQREAILYRGCKRTILAAAKRQVKSAPTPEKSVAQDFIAFCKRKMMEYMGDDLKHFGYSFSQWFNHLNYAKQIKMAAVHEYLTGNCLPGFKSSHPQVYYRGIDSIPEKMLHYQGICKVEIQETDGKPRMVCSIPDLIKYVMGPVCWRLEEMAADHLPVYCGGMNLSEMEDKINHYIDQGFDLVAQGDGSAFDNTQDVSLKAIDRWVYQTIAPYVYHVPRDLFQYIANLAYKIMDINMRTPEGKLVTLMRYAVLGTVFSGDCDTTLMNTIRMGMYNWYTNERMGLKLGTHYVCWSKGDDFTVIYNRRLVSQEYVRAGYDRLWLKKPSTKSPGCDTNYDARQHGLGQILKMLDFGDPDSFAFCSLNAWYTDMGTGHITLTRNVKKLFTLSNYSRKIKTMDHLAASQYLVDQAEALIVSYGGIHIFDEAARCLLRRAEAMRLVAVSKRLGTKSVRDSRVALPLENHTMQSLYHITFRNKYHKLLAHASYWESVKQYEMVKENRLTGRALELVNRQIDSLFPSGQLTRKLFPA